MTRSTEAPRVETTGGRDSRAWLRLGLQLVWATMAYNFLEAIVAIGAGVRAGSVALVGFGLDSVIEMAAAGVLLWRLGVERRGADEAEIERTERRVRRFIGATFFALALYVVIQAGWVLWTADAPEESWIGIGLAIASLTIMPLVALGKLKAARKIPSASLRAEARETLACSYLSLSLLLGLAANAAAGWWWADPLVALLMVPWLVKEGIEGFGEDECGD